MLDKQVLSLQSPHKACLFALSIAALYNVISGNLFGNSYSIKTQVTYWEMISSYKNSENTYETRRKGNLCIIIEAAMQFCNVNNYFGDETAESSAQVTFSICFKCFSPILQQVVLCHKKLHISIT